MYKKKFTNQHDWDDYHKSEKIKKEDSVTIHDMRYKKVKVTCDHRAQITHGILIEMGFNYRMKFYTKNGFTIQFYKYIWKYGYRMTHEGELIYLDDLKSKYLEIIGIGIEM